MSDEKALEAKADAMIRQAQIAASQAHPAEIAWMSEILDRPWRIFYLNVVAGIGRGLGFALGVTILAGAVLTVGYKIARRAVTLPWVGHHVAEFISEVEQHSVEFKRLRQ